MGTLLDLVSEETQTTNHSAGTFIESCTNISSQLFEVEKARVKLASYLWLARCVKQLLRSYESYTNSSSNVTRTCLLILVCLTVSQGKSAKYNSDSLKSEPKSKLIGTSLYLITSNQLIVEHWGLFLIGTFGWSKRKGDTTGAEAWLPFIWILV